MCCWAGSERIRSPVSSHGRHLEAIGAGGRLRRLACAGMVLAFAVLVGLVPAEAARPNGAGIVVQFEDGSRIYAYVQFTEESLTSQELLLRSGLDVVVAPYGGLGAAVCSIQGEGCPSSNCFCRSYSHPAYFWRFYAWQGGWVEQPQGMTSRRVTDGSIDGWLWSAGDTQLPAVSIDEIAMMNGIDRTAPEPEPEPTSTPTSVPEPTVTPTLPPPPTATATTPPATTLPATATVPPAATATQGETVATETMPQPPTATPPAQGAAATSTPALAATVTATATATAPRPATATRTPTAEAPATTPPAPTVTPEPTTAAVFVPPDGTPVPLATMHEDDPSNRWGYVVFGSMAVLAVAAGGLAALRNRRGNGNGRVPPAP
jgi:hypothetical protein